MQPKPLFDTLEHVIALYQTWQQSRDDAVIQQWLTQCIARADLPDYALDDFRHVLCFLYTYRGSPDTFNGYRRECERLLQWSWWQRDTSMMCLQRLDIEAFIEFCQAPPAEWISTKTVARFHQREGRRCANPHWRPFNVKVSKCQFQQGIKADVSQFQLSQQGLKACFAVLSSFYNYLLQEDRVAHNPVSQIRQKSKFIQKQQHDKQIRRLSERQWQCVLDVADALADQQPHLHERTRFIMHALYGMYLRVSELAASARWTPRMADFFRDQHRNWWFQTVGKGNKRRQIAVSDAMLQSLMRWRKFLNLTPLPAPDEQMPLIPKQRGKGPLTSTRAIRLIVQDCFDRAVAQLRQHNEQEEAELLRAATVHWLRHTGISDDVKQRPREHVRDDAGHSSSAITDRYIDVELLERHASARKKFIDNG